MKKYIVGFACGEEKEIEAVSVEDAFNYLNPVNPMAFGTVVWVEEVE